MERLRRPEGVPWRSAGLMTESLNADEAVRSTGWVFNNMTGEGVSLAQFVDQGDREFTHYSRIMRLDAERARGRSILEIGSGIGRMTCAMTNAYRQVIAGDVDAAFLERCRESVFAHGTPMRLRTLHIPDGRTVELPDRSVDVVFSYITLQHCDRADALALTEQAVRVAAPGGRIALNYRTWVPFDVVLVPLGVLVRLAWRLPKVAKYMARVRPLTRLGWQANRLRPREVFAHLASRGVLDRLVDCEIVRSPHATFAIPDTARDVRARRIHRSHWWLVADVA
jgi:SAM-dependent methyltransferase